MRCKNCGGDYDILNNTRCPYCGTPNPAGKQMIADQNKAEKRFNAKRIKTIRETVLPVSCKIVKYISWFLSILCLIGFISIILVVLLNSSFIGIRNKANLPKYRIEAEKLYEEENFLELNMMIDEKDIFSILPKKYKDMYYLYYKYNSFLQEKTRFLQLVYSSETITLDRKQNHIENLLNQASSFLIYTSDILKKDYDNVDELDSKYIKCAEQYFEDVETFLRTLMGLTENEISALENKDYCLSDNGSQTVIPMDTLPVYTSQVYVKNDMPIVNAIIEREAWK